ncbi:hypothetical protein LCGC14_0665690 [marine sediment metagenome]|uniref:Uncharacterized protein n=1 Tax=marine sediment metagenome TaxID=412755 RepID=A0A0F9U0J0_9ZZZZ
MTKADEKAAAEKARCKARKKKCSNCKHRFTKGDKTWKCPECKTDRRCKNRPVEGYKVCRMHGARGGRPPGSKFSIARKIEAAFNRIMGNSTIWEMVEQQAAMGVRWEQLVLKLDDLKHEGVDVAAVLKQVNRAIKYVGQGDKGILTAKEALWEIRSLLEDSNREHNLWLQILQVTEFMRKNSDTQKKWARENLQNVPVSEVIEVMVFLQQAAFIFIPNPQDRKAYINRIRSYFPAAENTLIGDGTNDI